MNWDELWDRYSSTRRLARNTLTGYRANVRRFREHWPELLEPCQVQENHLLQWHQHESQRGISAVTATYALRSVISLLRWACRQDYLLLDPTNDVSLRKPNYKIPRILTQEEVERLLEAPLRANRRFIRGRDQAVLELLYASGVRGGELLALNLADLDLVDFGLAIRGGKGRPRIASFAPSAAPVLERYLKDFRPVCAQPGESALFVSLDGTRMKHGSLNQQLRHYGLVLGIPDVTPHAFRRAFATHLIENGANIVEIKNLLGHADIDSTRVYARIFPLELLRAHKKAHPRARRRKEKRDDH